MQKVLNTTDNRSIFTIRILQKYAGGQVFTTCPHGDVSVLLQTLHSWLEGGYHICVCVHIL